MAENRTPGTTKKEHPATTLSKAFEAKKREIGKLERADSEKNKERIGKLHQEALDLLQQMKELDDKSTRSIERSFERVRDSLQLELEPVIEEAETVLSDAEVEEKAIRELLAEYDTEKEANNQKIKELMESGTLAQEPTPGPVTRMEPIVADGSDSTEAPVVEEQQPTSQLVPTPDKPKRGRKPKKQVPDPAIAPEDPTEEAPNIDQESWLTQEVESFIAEFGLEEFLPADFRNLKQEQQLKTIRDLKQRIVDIVKQDAKAHHLETVSNEKSRASLFGKLAIGVREAFKKESSIKDEESREFAKIKGTEDGKKLVAEQMKLLADINGSQEIVLGKNGELLIDYTNELKIGDGSIQRAQREEYNVAANAFRAIPYEWSQGKEGSRERMAYEDARAAYDAAVEKVLEIKRFVPGGEPQAVKEMIEVRNSLMLEQLLNTHPEIEIEFGKLGQEAGNEQVWETIRRLTGTQNRQNAGLFVAGFGVRTLTKATLGAIAMPIVGAVFGGVRAKFKAKETLVERRKDARYGGRDNSNEAEKVVDADKMANHIDNILNQLEQVNISDEKRLALEKRLQIRIDVALEKIESGLLNFGNSKHALLNQYRLTENLNRALARSALFDETVREEVSARTSAIMSFREGNIAEAQQKYIEEQILMGALRGAGIATAGYIVRAIGESAGWWGGAESTVPAAPEEKVNTDLVDNTNKAAPLSPEYAGRPGVAGVITHTEADLLEMKSLAEKIKMMESDTMGRYSEAQIALAKSHLQAMENGTETLDTTTVVTPISPDVAQTERDTTGSTFTERESEKVVTTPTETQTSTDSTTVSKPKPIEGGGKAKTPEPRAGGEGADKEVAGERSARTDSKMVVENVEVGEPMVKILKDMDTHWTSGTTVPAEFIPVFSNAESFVQANDLNDLVIEKNDVVTFNENKDLVLVRGGRTHILAKYNANEDYGKGNWKETIQQAKQTPSSPREEGVTDTENRSGETRKDTVVEEEKPQVNRRPGRMAKQDTGSTEAKPRNIPPAPEAKDLPPGMDAKAVVGKGGGITFAFKQQIEAADPEFAEALKEQIGYQGSTDSPEFYEALGRKFGYIKADGEWIGVKGVGNDTAYKFEFENGKYVVHEYHANEGTWEAGEIHRTGTDNFEGEDYEKEYEYLNEPKRKPELADGDGDEATEPGPSDDNGQLARKARVDTGDLNNDQLSRAPKTGTQNLDNGQLARGPEGAGNPPENNRTRTVSKVDRVVPPVEKGRPVILESDKQDVKWTIEPGPPDGRPWIVEDFKLVGGKSLRLFADRYGYDELTNSQVDFVGQRYRFNLNKIFEKSSDWTDKWSKEPATRLLRVDVGDTVSGNKEELSAYIKMLNKATGMKPFNDGFVGNKETTKDYILRMLFELEKRGKLDAFNDKFDAFAKGVETPEVNISVDEAAGIEKTSVPSLDKLEMYDLWEKYRTRPESLSEEEYALVEKVEELRNKLGSENFTGIKNDETAKEYLHRLEQKFKQVKSVEPENKPISETRTQDADKNIEVNKTQKPIVSETEKIPNTSYKEYPVLEAGEYQMVSGVKSEQVFMETEGKKTNVATVFYFDSKKISASFISNDQHPECFNAGGAQIVDYAKVDKVVGQKGEDLVIGFAGAYRSPDGNIEGVAYENGVSVGQTNYSKWAGFVYISEKGEIDLFRAKTDSGAFDQSLADSLVEKAQRNKGSLYQQIPAIWEGKLKLNSTKTGLYEMRAICESADGKQFIIDSQNKMTQAEFLKMCLDIKDSKGKSVVYNLMLTDTGECSKAVFREQNGTEHNIVDDQFGQKGFTNVVVLSKK